MKKYAVLGIMLIIVGAILFSIPALAEPTYSEKTKRASIEDKADILTEEEESVLLNTAAKMSKESGFEIRIVTTDDAEGTASSDYAENYYESLSEDYEGGCFLLDLDNREYYIATYGDLRFYITDDRLDELISNAGVKAREGDWMGVFTSMLADTEKYIDEGILPGTALYDADTGEYTFYSVLDTLSREELIYLRNEIDRRLAEMPGTVETETEG